MAKFKISKLNSNKEMKLELDLKAFIPSDDLCRVIMEIVSELDTSSIESKYSEQGQGAYHPKMMLCLIFYGYTQGIRSGRKLNKSCCRDIKFIFLTGGLCPSKSVINDFRKDHYAVFADLFGQLVRKCLAMGLIEEAQTVYGDGTKIRANASARRSKSKRRYEKWLDHLEADIEELEQTLEQDPDESDSDEADPNQGDLSQELSGKKHLAAKVNQVLDEFKDRGDPAKINLTDVDAVFMRGKKNHKDTFYNPQIVVDHSQFILHNHVSTSSSDKQQLQPCMEGVKKNIGHYPPQGCFDSGYSSFDNEQYLENNHIKGYIPDQDFGKTFKDQPFHHHHFQYDPKVDRYICPKGKPLLFHRNKNYDGYQYRVYQGIACAQCPYRSQCTKAKARTIHREKRQPLRDQTYYRLLTSKGQQIYARRKHTVEPVFGHLKHNLGYTYFLLRTLDKVQAEFNIMCIAYNLMKIAPKWAKSSALHLFETGKRLYHKAEQYLNPIFNELVGVFKTILYIQISLKC